VTSTEGLDELVVSGTASRHDIKTIIFRNLDGVKSNACCNA
jgi:methionine synthase II (cobalamin-independent)